MQKGLLKGVLWGLLPLFPLNIYSQNRTDSLQRLDEVTVVAPSLNKKLNPVQELSGRTLQKLSVHNVADALRYFSGIQIKDYGGIGGLKTVNIRSMGTNHVGVFYDGIELGNAQNGTVDLGRFSLDNMESITLYNSQKSVVFQPAKDFSSAGSIYMQSKSPSFLDGKKQHFQVTFKTGSFGLVNPSLKWERQINQKVSSALSAEYMYTTGKYKFSYSTRDGYDTTAVRKNGDVRAFRVEGALFGKLKSGYWRLKTYAYNSGRGYPGAVVRNKFFHEDRQYDTNLFIQGSLKRDFTPKYSMMVNGKLAYDYLHYLADPRRDEALMYVNNKYRQTEGYLSIANRFRLTSFWNVGVSADYQMNLLDANLTDFFYPRRHTLLMAAATELNFRQLNVQASLLSTCVHDKVTQDTVSAPTKIEWTPTLSCSYRPFRYIDLNIRGFYKRIFRMPTLNDLYYTFIGNVNLKPEFTTQYDLGFAYKTEFPHSWLDHIEIQADGYYNEIDNKIIATPTANFFRWTMVNLGKVKIKGMDAAVGGVFHIGRQFRGMMRLNYTYQQAQDFTDKTDEFYGGQIPYIPWNSGSAIIGLGYRGLELNYSFIYTGQRYSSQANIPVNYLQPWYTSDLSIAKEFQTGASHLRLALEVNNIFNQQYEVVNSYPMPGINCRVIAQYRF